MKEKIIELRAELGIAIKLISQSIADVRTLNKDQENKLKQAHNQLVEVRNWFDGQTGNV